MELLCSKIACINNLSLCPFVPLSLQEATLLGNIAFPKSYVPHIGGFLLESSTGDYRMRVEMTSHEPSIS